MMTGESVRAIRNGEISPVIWYDAITSTSDGVRRHARDDAALPFAVAAHMQTAGRGRQGRAWAAGRDEGLYASVGLDSRALPPQIQHLGLCIAVAVARAIKDWSGRLAPVIKWPNDILLEHKKVCGILCELRGTLVVAGIGINLTTPPGGYPGELGDKAVALDRFGPAPAPQAMLELLLARLEETLALWRNDFPGVIAQYRDFMLPPCTPVTAQGEGVALRGEIQGISPDGALLIRTESGVARIISGEVSVRPDGYT